MNHELSSGGVGFSMNRNMNRREPSVELWIFQSFKDMYFKI